MIWAVCLEPRAKPCTELVEQDIELAEEVNELKHQLDFYDRDIEERNLVLLTLHQPMAKDLRKILTVGKVICDLERMGDQVRWIARLTIHLYDDGKNPPPQQLLSDIRRMADYVEQDIKNDEI